MFAKLSVFAVIFLLTSGFFACAQNHSMSEHGNIPGTHSCFIENKGQIVDAGCRIRPDILFRLRDKNTTVFISANSIDYQFEKLEFPENTGNIPQLLHLGPDANTVRRSTHRMTVSLQNANPLALVSGEHQNSYTESYYFPHCPLGITARAFSKIVFRNVYPGIDWILHAGNGDGSGITYDFLVHPGADPSRISLKIDDADEVRISENGELILKNSLALVTEHAPVSFSDGERIATRFNKTGDQIRFELGPYDHQQDLLIDPRVVWATYYGGGSVEEGRAVATDAAGNVYMAGMTNSISGVAASGFQMNYGGNILDGFIAKFDSTGLRLWATYYGGNGIDQIYACATDKSGNVFCAGKTTSTNLSSSGAFQTSLAGGGDGMLVKFNSSGVRQWGTYFGGTNDDVVYACATDAWGNSYIAGTTTSPGLGYKGFQDTINTTATQDGFLAKFSPSGNRIWSTYYGGSGTENANGCATNAAGDVYLCGETHSTTGIATTGAFMTALNATGSTHTSDGYLAKFDSGGKRIWGTYFGGSNYDDASGVATDPTGNIFLVGATLSPTGIASGGFLNTLVPSGNSNMFVTKFTDAGQRLWGTYYSGDSSNFAFACSTDSAGSVYFSGATESTTGIAFRGIQNKLAGEADAFLVKLDSAGKRQWATYYGGTKVEISGKCATDRFGNVFLLGGTYSPTGIAQNGFQNTLYGSGDAFLVKIGDSVIITTDSLKKLTYCAGDTIPVAFHSIGKLFPGNVFTAQLSDASGNFLTPVNIGSLSSTRNIDTIIAVIPATTPVGNRYRLRVVSSLPVAVGEDNGVDFSVHTKPTQPGPITGNDTACSGSSQTYSVPPVPDALSYIWTLPAGWSGSSSTNRITATAGTSGGTIIVVAVNSCGPSLPSLRTVIAGNYFVTPTISIPHTVSCAGKSTIIRATATYAGTSPVYQWKKNGFNAGTNSPLFIDSSLKTGDIISVSLTSNADCITQPQAFSKEDTIIVGTTTYPGINVNSNPPIILCDGAPIRFVTNIVAGGKSPAYQWYKNNIIIPGATAAKYTDSMLRNGDTLTVALYSSEDCPNTQPTMSNHVGVTVHPNLTTSVSVTASPDSLVRGSVVTFTAAPVNGGLNPSYTWFLNGTANYVGPSDTWTMSGLNDGDAVVVRMTSSLPCPVPASVMSPPLIMRSYSTGVFTFNGKAGSLKLYPNPTNGAVTLELSTSLSDARFTLSDALGRIVLSAPVTATKNVYDLSHLANGVYVYRIAFRDCDHFIGKLIKQ